MEPPADHHGAIFGSNNPPDNGTTTNYRCLHSPSIVHGNPRAPSAMPYLPSTVPSDPRAPSAVPYLPFAVHSNPRAQSVIPSLASTVHGDIKTPFTMPCLPSPVKIHPKPLSAMQVQAGAPVYHHHRIPITKALSPFVPPVRSTGGLHTGNIVGPPIANTVGPPRGDVVSSPIARRGIDSSPIGSTIVGPPIANTVDPPRGDVVSSPIARRGMDSSPIGSTVKAPPVHNKDQASSKRQQTETKRQQTETKKQKLSKTNKTSAIGKKAKTSKARTRNVRHDPSDENDVRNKSPEDWDEVMKIQQVLEAVIRSFGRVTAQPPPKVSPWCSYQHQRAVFQQASDHYWRLEKRPGQPPELARLGLWHGPVKSIINAPVEITEEDLEFATHPSVASYQPVPGSIAWLELNQNFDNVLKNQLQPNAHTQPPRRYLGVRTSSSQPKSFLVDGKATREQAVTPYQLGGLVASRIEGPIPANGGQSMSLMRHNEPAYLPYQLATLQHDRVFPESYNPFFGAGSAQDG